MWPTTDSGLACTARLSQEANDASDATAADSATVYAGQRRMRQDLATPSDGRILTQEGESREQCQACRAPDFQDDRKAEALRLEVRCMTSAALVSGASPEALGLFVGRAPHRACFRRPARGQVGDGQL